MSNNLCKNMYSIGKQKNSSTVCQKWFKKQLTGGRQLLLLWMFTLIRLFMETIQLWRKFSACRVDVSVTLISFIRAEERAAIRK